MQDAGDTSVSLVGAQHGMARLGPRLCSQEHCLGSCAFHISQPLPRQDSGLLGKRPLHRTPPPPVASSFNRRGRPQKPGLFEVMVRGPCQLHSRRSRLRLPRHAPAPGRVLVQHGSGQGQWSMAHDRLPSDFGSAADNMPAALIGPAFVRAPDRSTGGEPPHVR